MSSSYVPVQKLGRNYSLFVENIADDFININLPFTIEFDITRTLLNSSNTSNIKIFNLSQDHRNQIRKNFNNYGEVRSIQLYAGYGTNMPIIFSGNISEAWSVREGVNFITEINSFDGGDAYLTSHFEGTIPAGTTQAIKLKTFINSLNPNGVRLGAIGSIPGSLSRDNPYSGNTIDIITQETGPGAGSGFFIDNGIANYLNNNEYINGPTPVINSSSGLLGTPVLEDTYLTFDMILQPNLFIGQLVQLQSKTFQDVNGSNLNGFYKVVELHHKGMISPAVCGDAITSVGLFYGFGQMTGVDSEAQAGLFL